MEFMSCNMIASNYLNINGRIDEDEKPLMICCEPIKDSPATGFKDTPEETLQNYIGMRSIAIMENFPASSERTVTKSCLQCANFCRKEHPISLEINYVNLSMYPAPCQCRCIYCGVYKKYDDTPKVRESYEKLFDTLDHAVSSGVISPNAKWQVSTGEIAIHPYHDRIMKLVKGRNAVFYTNMFIYDEDVAHSLNTNPTSGLNFSIDSGTPETWHKIKGFDNFDKIKENLEKYRKMCKEPYQIGLKYIILPGINDTKEDYKGLIEIMNKLHVNFLILARDVNKKYDSSDEEYNRLMEAASYLAAHCLKNNIKTSMFLFKPQERQLITENARKLINSNQV